MVEARGRLAYLTGGPHEVASVPMTIQDTRRADAEVKITEKMLRAEMHLRWKDEISQTLCISPASAETVVDEIFEDVLFLLAERCALALPL